jgi:probable addiction module antidote protein
MGITTTRWNSAEHLQTEEDIQLYLEACLDEAGEDPKVLIHALNVIAFAKNVGHLDKDIQSTKENFDQLITPDDRPTFAMIAKCLHSLGFRLTVEPIT